MGKKARKFRPAHRLIFLFIFLIFSGTLILLLPGMTLYPLSIIDAFFTSTSAVCLTGLTVVETGEFFTRAGQTVILILIQLGGLGYMGMASIIVVLAGRVSIGGKLMLDQQVFKSGRTGLKRFIFRVISITLLFQAAGAAFLAWRISGLFDSFSSAAYNALFHSVSAFNNAGFDIFGSGRSLTPLREDFPAVIIISVLIISGGLGYVVINDLWNNLKEKLKGGKIRLSTHSKAVLLTTGVLIAGGTVVYFLGERGNSATLGGLTPGGRWLMAFFQSVTPRTAGFNMIETAGLINFSIMFTIIMMFIGASPGGTGGGIKTTTFLVVLASVKNLFKKDDDINMFKRRLSGDIIKKAMMIFIIAACTIMISSLILMAVEPFSIRKILFETVSAFGTVGLSTGITSHLSEGSKIVVILTMFIGRLGPITVLGAFLTGPVRKRYRYPVQDIGIG